MDYLSEGPLIEDHVWWQIRWMMMMNTPIRYRVAIDKLPDDVLLEIFDYYVTKADEDRKYEKWQILVHVCQNWRYMVFQSPLRLNLRILCLTETPVKKKLAVWPPFPIVIKQYSLTSQHDEDNIMAALGHVDRICEIFLSDPKESILAEMQKTFMALEDLSLYPMSNTVSPVISDSFLGGSAPRLRHLSLAHVQFLFPVLRNLLFSAPNLSILSLSRIPHSSYFSPEVMVTCLSALTRLSRLHIGFESPLSRPPRRNPLPTRPVLLSLTELRFIGASEYLEDLVTRIDAPLLNHLFTRFFHQLIFDTPQLVLFISRTPKLKAYNSAHAIFSDSHADISLPGTYDTGLEMGISCKQSDWQLSSLAQICTSSIPQAFIPVLEHLYIRGHINWRPRWQNDVEKNQWLEFFHPFTTVKNLYLSWEFIRGVTPTLKEIVGGGVAEVLPNLESIFLEELREPGQVPEPIQQFIATLQFSGRPIAISPWNRRNEQLSIYRY